MLFAASRFSNARVREGREGRPVRVHHLAVRVAAISDVVHIPPVQPAPASLRVQEWAERRDCRLRECRPSPPDVLVRLRAVPVSVISTDLKKVQ